MWHRTRHEIPLSKRFCCSIRVITDYDDLRLARQLRRAYSDSGLRESTDDVGCCTGTIFKMHQHDVLMSYNMQSCLREASVRVGGSLEHEVNFIAMGPRCRP